MKKSFIGIAIVVLTIGIGIGTGIYFLTKKENKNLKDLELKYELDDYIEKINIFNEIYDKVAFDKDYDENEFGEISNCRTLSAKVSSEYIEQFKDLYLKESELIKINKDFDSELLEVCKPKDCIITRINPSMYELKEDGSKMYLEIKETGTESSFELKEKDGKLMFNSPVVYCIK